MEPHSICQGWRGQQARRLAFCQAQQEGGSSILWPFEGFASAKLGVSARGGEADGHFVHLSFRGLARRHLQSEKGRHSTTRSSRRGQALGSLGRPDPAWLSAAARPAPSLHLGAGFSELYKTKRKGLSPAWRGRSGASSHRSLYFPSSASGGGTGWGQEVAR